MFGLQTTASRLALSLQQVKPSVCTSCLCTLSDIINTTLWSRTGQSPGARVEVKRGGQSELFGFHPTATRWRPAQSPDLSHMELDWDGLDRRSGGSPYLISAVEHQRVPLYSLFLITAHLFFALLSQTVRQSLLRLTHSATHSCVFVLQQQLLTVLLIMCVIFDGFWIMQL